MNIVYPAAFSLQFVWPTYSLYPHNEAFNRNSDLLHFLESIPGSSFKALLGLSVRFDATGTI